MMIGNPIDVIDKSGKLDRDPAELKEVDLTKIDTFLNMQKTLNNSNASNKSVREEAEEVFDNGKMFFECLQKETATKYFKKSIEIDPTFHKPYLSLMVYFEGIRDFKNALKYCHILLGLDKSNFSDEELEVLRKDSKYFESRLKLEK